MVCGCGNTNASVCVWQSEDNRMESFLSTHLTRLPGITLKCQDLHSQHLYPMINLTDPYFSTFGHSFVCERCPMTPEDLSATGPLRCYSELGCSVPLKIRCDSSCSHLACSLKMTPQDLITWHLSFAEASKQIAENKNTPRVSIFVCGRHTRQVILEIQKLNSVIRLD